MSGGISQAVESFAAALLSPALGVLQGSAEALAGLSGGGALAWRELAETLRAFDGFQRAGELLDPAQGPVSSLAEGLARASRLEPWRRLWALEGLGYAAGRDGTGDGLLAGASLPVWALIPLHTGLGLALAARAVEEGARTGLAAALRAFRARCRGSALPGGEGAMLEALGLAARTLRPERAGEIARCLARLEDGEQLTSFFWHGVGRALHFVPSHLLPWDQDGALGEARREPPSEAGRRNAVAGLGWAKTLVGLRQPEALDSLLERCAGPEGEALEHGATGAVLVWACVNGRDALLERFLGYRGSDPARWRRRVAGPCERALAVHLPAAQAGRFGDLFHLAARSAR